MPNLTIENAPEETLKALEMIAEQTHQTVSAVALDFLPKQPPLSSDERRVLVERLRQESGIDKVRMDSTPLIRRDRDGVSQNKLSPQSAIDLSRELRGMALTKSLPDNTPAIRADRDAR